MDDEDDVFHELLLRLAIKRLSIQFGTHPQPAVFAAPDALADPYITKRDAMSIKHSFYKFQPSLYLDLLADGGRMIRRRRQMTTFNIDPAAAAGRHVSPAMRDVARVAGLLALTLAAGIAVSLFAGGDAGPSGTAPDWHGNVMRSSDR
ncbi:hypothetical protein [Tranquillimonas rosea]|nr:hypothetical protein [Tranquillimonas rosea]